MDSYCGFIKMISCGFHADSKNIISFISLSHHSSFSLTQGHASGWDFFHIGGTALCLKKTEWKVIDRCCDDPDCARNADKLSWSQFVLPHFSEVQKKNQ